MALLDVEMPGLDGMAVCAAIRQSHGDAFPVLVTGRHDAEFLARAQSPGGRASRQAGGVGGAGRHAAQPPGGRQADCACGRRRRSALSHERLGCRKQGRILCWRQLTWKRQLKFGPACPNDAE
jgi:hypothetical protein